MEASGARVAGALGGSAVAWVPAGSVPTFANSVALAPELVLGKPSQRPLPKGLSVPQEEYHHLANTKDLPVGRP